MEENNFWQNFDNFLKQITEKYLAIIMSNGDLAEIIDARKNLEDELRQVESEIPYGVLKLRMFEFLKQKFQSELKKKNFKDEQKVLDEIFPEDKDAFKSLWKQAQDFGTARKNKKIHETRIEIESLRERIRYHSNKYYNENTSEISDAEFDQLMQQLKQLESENPELITKDSPTQIVGGKANPKVGDEITHDVQMLSLNDVFDEGKIEKFITDIQKKNLKSPEFVVEQKIDGLSVAIRYVYGIFWRAITRGNGKIGEDVTSKVVRMVKDLPMKLKDPIPYFEIRGEIYVDKETLQRIMTNKSQMNFSHSKILEILLLE